MSGPWTCRSLTNETKPGQGKQNVKPENIRVSDGGEGRSRTSPSVKNFSAISGHQLECLPDETCHFLSRASPLAQGSRMHPHHGDSDRPPYQTHVPRHCPRFQWP